MSFGALPPTAGAENGGALVHHPAAGTTAVIERSASYFAHRF